MLPGARTLVLKSAEILVFPVAWEMNKIGAVPTTDHMGYLYDLFDRARASENGCWFISSNQFSICGEMDYYGHSQIVGPHGDIKVSTGYREGLVTAKVNIHGEMLKARASDLATPYLKDRRPHAYKGIHY
jgi:predicted amidohydrolase